MAALLSAGCAKHNELLPELDFESFASPQGDEPWTGRAQNGESIGFFPQRVQPMWVDDAALELANTPQSLMQLVALALARNPETRAAWENARASAARYGSVRSAWYPTFGLDASLVYDSVLFPAGNFDVLDIRELALTTGVSIDYILLDFGRRDSQDAIARHALWAANLQFNRRLQETVYDVERTYFALDAANGLLQASERELELALTIIAAVEDRMTVGLATMPELLVARQELAHAEFDVQLRYSGIADAKSALLVAIGLPAPTPISIQMLHELPMPEALALGVNESIDQALASRPDLAAAVESLRLSEASVRLAEAAFRPIVTLDGNVAWQQFTSNANVNRDPYDSVAFGGPIWNVGVAGTWIFFEGYALKNNLREARALRRKARSELESIRIQAIGEVWDSYNDYLAAQRQFVFGEALLASSQEAYEAMLAAYEVGLATITELIASEKDLAASMAILVETRAKLLQSAARVGFALGSGFGAVPQVAKATNEP